MGAVRGDSQAYAKRPRSTPMLDAAATADSTTISSAEPDFLTFSDFIRYREQVRPSALTTDKTGFHGLGDVYRDLLRLPCEGGIIGVDRALEAAIQSLDYSPSNEGITNSLGTMKPYWKWIVAVYGEEVVNRFGGLQIVEPGLLPMGMVKMFKDRKVNWDA